MSTLHFRDSEFACKCCDTIKLDPHLLAVLELVRHHFDKPIFINSGYRCPEHNAQVGGTPKSQHVEGTAADIDVSDIPPATVYAFLDKVFPNSYGLGKYDTFTHIDVRSTKARW